MFCKWCGAENTDNARFCRKCGKEIKPSEVKNRGNKNNKSNKLVFIICGIVLAFAIGGTTFFIHQKQQEKIYSQNVELGMKYLEEQEYEKAEVAFLAAIDIEPKEIRLYHGLADAYVGMNDYDNATEVYEDAIAIIDEEYEKTEMLLDDSEALYLDAIVHYGVIEKFDNSIVLVERLLNMTEDTAVIEELKELQIYLGRYPAYIELLEKYTEEYGEGSITGEDVNLCFASGLCMARLCDFNNDGAKELLLAYEKGNNNNTDFVVEVWDYKNGELVKVYEGDPLTTGSPSMQVSNYYKEGDFSYLREGWIADVADYSLFGYDGNKFESIYTYKTDYDTNSDYAYLVYSVNNKKVSESEWYQEMSRWDDYAQIEYYLVAERTEINRTLKTCTNTYRELLEAVENYNNSDEKEEPIEIVFEWSGTNETGDLIDLAISMDGLLEDDTQVSLSNSVSEAYGEDGKLLATYDKKNDTNNGSVTITIYDSNGVYSFTGDNYNYGIPGETYMSIANIEDLKIKVSGKYVEEFEFDDALRRGVTGYWYLVFFNIDHGKITEFNDLVLF